ncbi:MAG: PorT family protein [Lewinellaceae bacterium]|nr:PorT family protein [Lewinellaceae bacterium]
MKKISSLTILLALCLGVATSATAQVRFGVKAGLNLANLTGDDLDGTKMLPTFMIGGQAEFGLSDALGLGVGLQLQGKGVKAEEEDASIAPMYLQVPVYLTYRNNGFFAGVGPYFGFGIAGKNKFDGESENISFGSSFDDDLSALDFGAGLELGYEFGNLRASASYNLGLANALPKDVADELDLSAKHAVIGLALAYLFGAGE